MAQAFQVGVNAPQPQAGLGFPGLGPQMPTFSTQVWPGGQLPTSPPRPVGAGSLLNPFDPMAQFLAGAGAPPMPNVPWLGGPRPTVLPTSVTGQTFAGHAVVEPPRYFQGTPGLFSTVAPQKGVPVPPTRTVFPLSSFALGGAGGAASALLGLGQGPGHHFSSPVGDSPKVAAGAAGVSSTSVMGDVVRAASVVGASASGLAQRDMTRPSARAASTSMGRAVVWTGMPSMPRALLGDVSGLNPDYAAPQDQNGSDDVSPELLSDYANRLADAGVRGDLIHAAYEAIRSGAFAEAEVAAGSGTWSGVIERVKTENSVKDAGVAARRLQQVHAVWFWLLRCIRFILLGRCRFDPSYDYIYPWLREAFKVDRIELTTFLVPPQNTRDHAASIRRSGKTIMVQDTPTAHRGIESQARDLIHEVGHFAQGVWPPDPPPPSGDQAWTDYAREHSELTDKTGHVFAFLNRCCPFPTSLAGLMRDYKDSGDSGTSDPGTGDNRGAESPPEDDDEVQKQQNRKSGSNRGESEKETLAQYDAGMSSVQAPPDAAMVQIRVTPPPPSAFSDRLRLLVDRGRILG